MCFFGRRKTSELSYDYDPQVERPVIRASICTGEEVAGFKDKKTGEFHEVMLVRDEADRKRFMEAFGLENVEKEY